jgi:hypothetical protein
MALRLRTQFFAPKNTKNFNREIVDSVFHGFRRFVHGGILELNFPTIWKAGLNRRSTLSVYHLVGARLLRF